MAESFFATLKTELVYRRAWPTRHEREMEVFSYIEGFYNPRRRHSRLDNLSPADLEDVAEVGPRALSGVEGSAQAAGHVVAGVFPAAAADQ
jgi:Integrase core domain